MVFFLYLNIQEHSLSNVHYHQCYKEQDTNCKKQWKMLIKLKELSRFFFIFIFFYFFLIFCRFFCFCFFIFVPFCWFFLVSKLGFSGQKKEKKFKVCEKKATDQSATTTNVKGMKKETEKCDALNTIKESMSCRGEWENEREDKCSSS